jgi:hypothetical protein
VSSEAAGPETAAPIVPETHARPGRRPSTGLPSLSGQLVLLLGLIVGGVLLALLWRLLDPSTAKLGDDNESAAAVDSTLALLGVLAGFLTAAFVLLRPGSAPATRTVVAILGSVVGAVISWLVGNAVGTPALRAHGATFVWPFATAAFIFFGALLPVTSQRLTTPVPRAVPEPQPFVLPPSLPPS